MRHTLSSIPNIKPLYFLPDDPFSDEVLIPAFCVATAVECMMGYFSSDVLSSLAPGLATFINHSEGRFRLIVCPMLRVEDLRAIERGVKSSEDVALDCLKDVVFTKDLVEKHTLKCLTWLIRAGRVEIRVALMRGALFHPKVWLLRGSGDEVISAHGSSNLTEAGLSRNIEQIAVSASWDTADQRYTIRKLCDQFSELWANRNQNCVVLDLPTAIRQSLLKTYGSDRPPQESDLYEIYQRTTMQLADPPSRYDVNRHQFSIPSDLRYDVAPYAHQGEAVNAWYKAGYRGILEMATGSGKTITAMLCAHRLYEAHRPLLIVVSAPYIPLIKQWCDEIIPFGIAPVNLSAEAGPVRRANVLGRIRRQMRRADDSVQAVVVSHDTLCDSRFKEQVAGFECAKLIVADEVHNLGRSQFISDPPLFFDFRLGLSATPERQFDDDGTKELFSFFGPVVYDYPLSKAIGNCLVPYDYFVHPVELTTDELGKWEDISERIRKIAWRQKEGDPPDEFLTRLLRDRRTVLENAENKIAALKDALLSETRKSLQFTLIYASDKNPDQMRKINLLLQGRGVMFRQVTHLETANRKETAEILDAFQNGTLHILIAKRVLDEGVNIPEVRKAYILASTTVERQWTQRRGRLLRRCDRIGKTHSEIHDFVALPPSNSQSQEDRAIIRSELGRVHEFASLARNAGSPTGPLVVLDELVKSAYM